MKKQLRFLFLVCSIAGYSAITWAQPSIGIFADKNYYILSSDEQLNVSIAGEGDAQREVVVDVHLGLIGPDGKIYEYPDWNTQLKPWLPSFRVPAGFKYEPHVFFNLQQFPHLSAGPWRAAAAVTKPGTLEIISFASQWINVMVPDSAGSRFGFLTMNDSKVGQTISQNASGSFIEFNFGGQLDPDKIDQIIKNMAASSVPIDQCQYTETKSKFDPLNPLPGTSPVFLDAGEKLTLSSEGGNTVDVPVNDNLKAAGFFIYQADLPGGFYEGQGKYTFAGEGGSQIGPFSTTLRAPAPLVLTSPNFSSGVFLHPASSDLALQWNGQNSQGSLDVTVSTSSFDIGNIGGDVVVKTIRCRFVDDGQASIPGALLSRLDKQFGPATFNAARSRQTAFNTEDGALDFGLYSINTSVSGSLALQ
ncbi:MAG: hypothetical protein AXA67_00245 [Methylothermaceae bacteria B42]|nr:MAG: hypothetical protein AXA67_00245 [Methylothermaceae bacteria B42]HHJ38854.1 hypothetical protein [Methylothermaceae bacterium]